MNADDSTASQSKFQLLKGLPKKLKWIIISFMAFTLFLVGCTELQNSKKPVLWWQQQNHVAQKQVRASTYNKTGNKKGSQWKWNKN